jgi:hypothetical protein
MRLKCGGPADGKCCCDAAVMLHGAAIVRLPCGGAAAVRPFGRLRCCCDAVEVQWCCGSAVWRGVAAVICWGGATAISFSVSLSQSAIFHSCHSTPIPHLKQKEEETVKDYVQQIQQTKTTLIICCSYDTTFNDDIREISSNLRSHTQSLSPHFTSSAHFWCSFLYLLLLLGTSITFFDWSLKWLPQTNRKTEISLW